MSADSTANTDQGAAPYVVEAVTQEYMIDALGMMDAHGWAKDKGAMVGFVGAWMITSALVQLDETLNGQLPDLVAQAKEMNAWHASRDTQGAVVAGALYRLAALAASLAKELPAVVEAEQEHAAELRGLLESLDLQMTEIAASLEQFAKGRP